MRANDAFRELFLFVTNVKQLAKVVLAELLHVSDLPPSAYVLQEGTRLHLVSREQLQEGVLLPVDSHQRHSKTSPSRIIYTHTFDRDESHAFIQRKQSIF